MGRVSFGAVLFILVHTVVAFPYMHGGVIWCKQTNSEIMTVAIPDGLCV